MRPILLAAAAGYVLVLAFPPAGLGVLALPAIAAFLVAVRSARRPGEAWAAGAAFGVVFFGFLFPWLAELGVIALMPLVAVQASFPTVYARALYRARHLPAGPWMLTAAAGWGAMEYVRERFPLGGFGWGMAGYPVGEYAWLRNAAQWIGTSGWSVVVALAAAAVAWAVTDRRLETRILAPFALIALLGLGGALFPPLTTGQAVDVVLVQGSSPCPGQRCAGERAATFEASLDLTSRIPPGTADLVVWPEGSTGFNVDPILDPAVGESIAAEAVRIGAVLLVGGDRPVSETEWINANVVWDRDGTLLGEYRKRHPVPFGEYVPARPMFAWIPDLSRVPRDMIRGDGPELFEVDGGLLGSVISFESSFSRYSRDHVRAGAGLLVVATSQASYPYSDASDQLIGMTRMRSAELGVDVVHGSVTGRSTLITDGGVVGERTGLAEVTSLAGTVQFRDGGPTLYTLLGDWVPLVGMAWLLDRSIRSGIRRSGRGARARTAASSH